MTRLERLGAFCAAQPRRVLRIAATVAVCLAVAAIIWGGELVDGVNVVGSDSHAAIDLAAKRDPTQLGVTARVVFVADHDPIDTPELSARIADALDVIKHQPTVDHVVAPIAIAGADPTTTFAEVVYQPGDPPHDAMRRLHDTANSIAGVRGEIGGVLPEVVSDPDAGSEVFGLLAALVILLVAFGSMMAAAVPLLLAIAALGVGFAAVLLTASLADVPSLAPQLASMIGLGVGIDYALIIITRYRELVDDGLERQEAIATSIATAGRSVLFAGATVVVSICGLALTGIELLAMMGVATSLCVAATVVANLTLLPALLSMLGPRIDGWTTRRRAHHAARTHARREHRDIWTRWAAFAMHHSVPASIAAIVVLLALAAPSLDMTLGYTDASTAARTTTERKAFDLLATRVAPGANVDLSAVVDLADARPAERGDAVDTTAEALRSAPGVLAVGVATFSGDRVAAIPFFTTTGPQDVATRHTVEDLRDHVLPSALHDSGARAHIGGATAIHIDFAQRVADRLALFVGGVVALSMVLLYFVFRAVVVAVKAALMNLLSIGAAYGVVVAVFQWGWGSSLLGIDERLPIDAFVPVFLFAILFGLSMDYEVFLLSRIREEWRRTGDNDAAVLSGISSTAHVITSAAMVMVGVFASFLFGGDPTVKMFGVGLTTAVIVDVTVVRMFLLPALMKLLGRANWWVPGRSGRILSAMQRAER